MTRLGTDEFVRLMVTWKGKILTIVITVLCVACIYKGKLDDPYIDSSSYPVDATNYLVTEAANGNINLDEIRLFNDYNYGSYLVYRDIPVFIDSRADLYSPEFNAECKVFDDYMSVSSISAYYEDKFEQYGVTHVITYKNSKLTMLLEKDENYKELYSDKHFIIYERLNVNTNAE